MSQNSDVIDRQPSGRFVRNLALSLSGGALLTLIGAGVAHADDAATASEGLGAAGTGDATAVGNRSGTQANQGTGASTGTGNIQIINQNAGVANVGVAVANTGGNIAVGNASVSGATADQTADGGVSGIGVNSGNASNASDGRAFIQTGDAYAIGNESTTTLDQRADGTAHGTLGGVLVLSQNAGVLNAGLAVSNTGLNGAVGNASGNPLNPLSVGPNTAGLLQEATSGSGGGGANNSGSASNDTNGHATISTGNASSIGNKSDTKVSQIAGSGDGDPEDSGLSVITQLGGALNAGAGISNTGLNGAVGNASSSGAFVGGPADPLADPQTADADFSGVGFANNSGSATNASDGTAWITTGDANSVGNDSRTAIVQDAHAEFGDGGAVNIQTQLAPVVNVGLGVANTGVNGAVGNVSTSFSDVSQAADGDAEDGTALFNVVSNQGEAANASDGTAEIHTGDAWGQGNWSDTKVSQWTEATGDALAVQTQAELVVNGGIGVANTGVNGAIGNVSANRASLAQFAELDASGTDPLLIGLSTTSNSGSASNDSDGTASITTGDAYASGNESTTRVGQAIDPTGVSIQTQAAVVANVGLAVSNSGVNGAVGNASDNGPDDGATLDQDNLVDDGDITAGVVTVANQGEASNTSDGTASITTGDAWSVGNHSDTGVSQVANASSDALGAVVNTQLGVVVNGGVGVANSGVNGAVGNSSSNRVEGVQDADVVGDVITGVLTSSNSGSATNDTDGTATITTGDTSAKGNVSVTDLAQTADGDVAGLGIAVNTQVGIVLNAGAGIANSGANIAIGNDSDSEAFLSQVNTIGGDDGALTIAPVVTASNAGDASNASAGTGEIHTGDAEAWGNTSDTRLAQRTAANVDGSGAIVNTQVGAVGNLGLGVANSGINGAIGNVSDNNAGTDVGAGGLDQFSQIGDTDTVTALGPITSSNAGSSSNSSDGLGYIHTGDAQAQGNVSATALGQDATGTIGEDGMGVVPNVQLAGTLNLGVGVANSGVNGAVGNASGSILNPLGPIVDEVNAAGLFQESIVAAPPSGTFPELTDAAGGDLFVAGPLTSSNNGEVANASNGTGKVFTGDALATGNVSSTNLNQNVRGNVDGMGLVVGPQTGVVVNAGLGVANSGINGAVGNLSNSTAASGQGAQFSNADDLTVLGPLTVGNNGAATNASDGEACSCTGDAVATGNVSTSTLSQDLNIGVDDGLSVVPMNGIILNAGFGLANSGVNGTIGNISQNLATSEQTAELDPDYDPIADGPLLGAQTVVNGGGADNASDGTGKVGTGNARADGNISSSDLVQGVSVDGAGAFALVNGGIGNVGAGVANSGINAGIGNASTNTAALDQDAEGTGTVSNQGRASNASDGFGGVGDPNCEVPGDEAPPAEETPGVPTLPKTGGPLEVEATIGLMLLLAGFGLRRAGRVAAKRG
ncbi:MAG: hypothetical protein M3Z03_05745 [Actinomycetota bacterium]|nr:hypothetical protein [Actinomycetota bacterium]